MSGSVANVASLPTPTQSRRAFGMVRALLLNGSFGPGERLSEPKLCDQLGISRTPVRAALTQLEFEGLLERRDSGGFQVREFSVTDVEDTIETRASLEALAVRFAIHRGVAPGLMVKARELLMCMDAVLNGSKLDSYSVNIYAARNRSFHALLAEMSGSEVVSRHLDHLARSHFGDPSAFVHARQAMPEARTAFLIAQEHHKQIINAISRRESARAEALLAEHALCGSRAMVHAIGSRRDDLVPGGRLIARASLKARAADAHSIG